MAARKNIPDDGLLARRSSAGLGLYTLKPIKKGTRIIEYVGRVIPKAETYTSRSKYLFEISSKKTIDGKPRFNKAGYINHSCRPNCEANTTGGRVFIKARRNIKKGEELTYDYGKEYWNEYIKPHGCRCVKCRH
jgi:SET domain-containing protein